MHTLRCTLARIAAIVWIALALAVPSLADDPPPAPPAGGAADGAPPAPGAPAAPVNPPADAPADPAATPPDVWADVPIVKLHQAAAAGIVDAAGRHPAAYQQVTLRVRNKSPRRCAVDLAGSHVTPKKRRCQRLGIGPAVTPSEATTGGGALILRLEPDEEQEIRVWTCCLDSGLPSPGSDDTFGASSAALPEVREKVLRWWVDNPTAPQSAVNHAIWTNAPAVRVAPGVVRDFESPKGRFAAVHRGVYYRLEDGRLDSIDPDGTRRVHGSEVFQVLPTDDGLYAVALGSDLKPKLWQIPMTAENGWRKVLDLDGTMRIRDLIAAGRGDFVLVTDKGVKWWDAAKSELRTALDSEVFSHLSVRRAAPDRLLVTILRPRKQPIRQGGEERFGASRKSEIWSLSLATGKAERTEEFWNVESILAGPGGIFALSHTQGHLRRFSGGKFVDAGPEFRAERLLSVSRDLVWLVGPDGNLVAADVKTGAVRHRTDVRATDDIAFVVDPENGDVAWVAGDRFRVLRGADGTQTTIE